jgi:hypothetical protein
LISEASPSLFVAKSLNFPPFSASNTAAFFFFSASSAASAFAFASLIV